MNIYANKFYSAIKEHGKLLVYLINGGGITSISFRPQHAEFYLTRDSVAA